MEEELKACRPTRASIRPGPRLQVTEIAGGTASNIVPVPCWFGWEIRALPGFDPSALDARLRRFAAEHCLPEMRRVAPEAGIEITITNQVPPFGADAKSGIVPLTLKLAGQNETLRRVLRHRGRPVPARRRARPSCAAPATSPRPTPPNEFVRVEELDKCLRFLGRLADWAEA